MPSFCWVRLTLRIRKVFNTLRTPVVRTSKMDIVVRLRLLNPEEFGESGKKKVQVRKWEQVNRSQNYQIFLNFGENSSQIWRKNRFSFRKSNFAKNCISYLKKKKTNNNNNNNNNKKPYHTLQPYHTLVGQDTNKMITFRSYRTRIRMISCLSAYVLMSEAIIKPKHTYSFCHQ